MTTAHPPTPWFTGEWVVRQAPVIYKTWNMMEQRQGEGEGVTEFFGTVSTFIDLDGLK